MDQNESNGFGAKLFDALFRQEPRMVFASLVGAFGILNLLDSLVVTYGGVAGSLLPDLLEPVFDPGQMVL